MSLIFDKFDVPVGYDSLKVYQLKCLDVECTKRNRVQMLSFPAGFDDAGRLPPLVHLQEQVGKPVHMTIRFTSRFASGSSGFIASCRPQVTAPTPMSSGVTGGVGGGGGADAWGGAKHAASLGHRCLRVLCLAAFGHGSCCREG